MKAIEVATANGWKGSPYTDIETLFKDYTKTDLLYGSGVWLTTVVYCPPHDFARALWGEDKHDADVGTYDVEWNRCSRCGGNDLLIDYCWQYYLMQMVIADDPIAYLGSTLTKEQT